MHRDRAGPAAPPPAHLALLLRAIAVGVTLVVRLPEIALRLDVEIALQLQPYVRAFICVEVVVCTYVCYVCVCVDVLALRPSACAPPQVRVSMYVRTYGCGYVRMCACTYGCMYATCT